MSVLCAVLMRNVFCYTESNKLGMLMVGAMKPLIALLQSDNIEVQCNACGCITTLATNGEFMVEHNLFFLTTYLFTKECKMISLMLQLRMVFVVAITQKVQLTLGYSGICLVKL